VLETREVERGKRVVADPVLRLAAHRLDQPRDEAPSGTVAGSLLHVTQE
jgi:hypothetical protein